MVSTCIKINFALLLTFSLYIVSIESFSSVAESCMIIVQASKREIKIQCINKESHDKWIQVRPTLSFKRFLLTSM